jgi:hypothetical protein
MPVNAFRPNGDFSRQNVRTEEWGAFICAQDKPAAAPASDAEPKFEVASVKKSGPTPQAASDLACNRVGVLR